MFRKRSQPPQRRPHPDPRTEAELQRILSLQRAVARKEAMLDHCHAEIQRMDRAMARHPTWDGHEVRADKIEELSEEAEDLEKEIPALHDDIAQRIAALSDTDLAYL